MINKGQAAWFGLAWLPVVCEKRIHCFLHKRILPNSLAIPKFEELFSFPILKNNHKNFREFNNSKSEHLPFVNKKQKFRLEIQMVQLIPLESFQKRWKSSDTFLFSRSNRNVWENAVPFINSHSTPFTSASFPAFRCCRCSRHFDLSLFSFKSLVARRKQ